MIHEFRSRAALAFLLITLSGGPGATTVTQSTQGWCSPATTNVQGHVTIICQGVDPRALRRLNELLDVKDLELKKKVQEAEEWANRYQELQDRLLLQSPNNPLSIQARNNLQEGKLDEAGEILDSLIRAAQENLKTLATYHFSRGQIFTLQFAYTSALPHYEAAAKYLPDILEYAEEYADTLSHLGHYQQAQQQYAVILAKLRNSNDRTSEQALDRYQKILHKYARASQNIGQYSTAHLAYLEALDLHQKLNILNPARFQCQEISVLNSLQSLFQETGKSYCAMQTFNKIVTAYNKADAQVCIRYSSDLAVAMLYNGKLGVMNGNDLEAEKAFRVALEAFRAFSELKGGQAYYDFAVDALLEISLVNLRLHDTAAAKANADEAVALIPSIVNPRYRSDHLETASNIYRNLGDLELAEQRLRAAIDLRNELHSTSAPEPDEKGRLADSEISLANLYRLLGRFPEARTALMEATALLRDVARDRARYFAELYRALGFSALLADETGDARQYESIRKEMAEIRKRIPRDSEPFGYGPNAAVQLKYVTQCSFP